MLRDITSPRDATKPANISSAILLFFHYMFCNMVCLFLFYLSDPSSRKTDNCTTIAMLESALNNSTFWNKNIGRSHSIIQQKKCTTTKIQKYTEQPSCSVWNKNPHSLTLYSYQVPALQDWASFYYAF